MDKIKKRGTSLFGITKEQATLTSLAWANVKANKPSHKTLNKYVTMLAWIDIRKFRFFLHHFLHVAIGYNGFGVR